MTITRVTPSSSIIEHAYQGAQKGAVVGARLGVSFISGVWVLGTSFNVLEQGNRAIGNEPKWPLFEGDCQLEQFRNECMCTNPPREVESLASFTAYVVGTTTITGIVIGAVAGAAKAVFSKSHSE